jgi:hypothetical protein
MQLTDKQVQTARPMGDRVAKLSDRRPAAWATFRRKTLESRLLIRRQAAQTPNWPLSHRIA